MYVYIYMYIYMYIYVCILCFRVNPQSRPFSNIRPKRISMG